jgi:imidazolonepropionase-like amidohydrolase
MAHEIGTMQLQTAIVILDADPLADIRNIRKIHRVIKGGVVYDPGQLLLTNK